MDDLVVVGGGGHAKVMISILKKTGLYRILGYTDVKDKGQILAVNFLGDDDVLETIIHDRGRCAAVLGVGHIRGADTRKRLAKRLESLGYDLPPVVSPHAIINEDVRIGQGTVILDGSVVNTGTRIGRCSIVNTNSTVDHDCEIGDYVHIGPGASLSGGVKVGNDSLVGTGATVIQYTRIGEGSVVGAGAVVVEDCLLPGTYLGVPARKVDL
jgi:UDP-perosamine 4-acetyltransferase